MKNNIIFIGFMGAGKTSIGMLYARENSREFVDTDSLIETREEMSISEIFDKFGEAVFRKKETDTLQLLLKTAENMVISVGGGLPLKAENHELLKKLGTVVFLKTTKDTVWERLQGDTTRPLLQGDQAKDQVEQLLNFRNPVYEKVADIVVLVDGKSFEEVLKEVEGKIK